ncbi:thromboxane-A synthase-like [Oppia nitens]|uniref:thromboxane-A synthase-like n=1 Tax=Oppia nitens TaxID=1686743 RepID=UPI0023D97CAE|nr:thromboxane-A synthase-like [Oppia nitens]
MICEILVFSLIFLILRCLLWLRNRRQRHRLFSENGIRGPKPSLLSGNYFEIKSDPNETFREWIQEFGQHFGYYLGDTPVLMITDPVVIREVLVSRSRQFQNRQKFFLNARPFVSSLLALRGDRWRHVRRVMTPFFSHHRVSSPEITAIIEESVDRSIAKIIDDQKFLVNVTDRMQSITLDIICRIGLDMRDTDVHDEDSQLKRAAQEFMASATNLVVIWASFLPFLRPVLTFINNYLTAGRMTDLLLKHLDRQITFATQSSSSSTSDPDSSSSKTISNNVLKSMLKSYFDGKLTREEVTGNSVLLILAAFDTTAMGLTFALYCLAKNPAVQQTLHREIQSNGGHECDYLNMVWYESLRLYPPVATFVQREASETVEIASDRLIPGGSICHVPVWHIHHNPDLWPEPDRFDPQRFAPENRSAIPSIAYLPFGTGPRSCIGLELAAHEARITLSKIIGKFRVETSAETPDRLEFRSTNGILSPKHSIYLQFIPINR